MAPREQKFPISNKTLGHSQFLQKKKESILQRNSHKLNQGFGRSEPSPFLDAVQTESTSKDQRNKGPSRKLFVLPSEAINHTIGRLQEISLFAKWCCIDGSNQDIIEWYSTWKNYFLSWLYLPFVRLEAWLRSSILQNQEISDLAMFGWTPL